MEITREQVRAALATTQAVAEAIRELGSVPSGVLYSQVSQYLSLNSYKKVIDTLKRVGLVRESGNVLTWVEPAPKVN